MLLNRDRAFRKMAEHGFDALVASALENVVYVSDFDPDGLYTGARTIELYAVLPPDGAPALVAPAFCLAWAADNPGWQVDLRLYGRFPTTGLSTPEAKVAERSQATALDALVSYLAQRGLADARLGIDEDGFHPRPGLGSRRCCPRPDWPPLQRSFGRSARSSRQKRSRD